jgi:tape measure domain-containing protein
VSDSIFDLEGEVGLDISKAMSGFDVLQRAIETQTEQLTSTLEKGFDSLTPKLEKKGEDAGIRIGKKFGKSISTAASIGMGDVGEAVDSLISITEAGLKGIPVVGTGIAAAFHEVSGVLVDATARGYAYNDFLKQQRIELDLVTGSASETKREVSEIADIAFKTNVGKSFLTDAVQDLQLFNVDGQRALDLARGLANQATATGGGSGRVVALTDLVERILETGKLDTRSVRQLIKQKVPVYDIIADELQVSKQKAMQLINSGALSGQDLITIFTDQFNNPKWQQAAEEMTQTIDGMTQRYNAGVNKLLGVATQPAYNTSLDFLRKAVETIRGPQAAAVATDVQSAIAPVTAMMEKVGAALASGDVFGGAVSAGQNIVSGLAKGIEERTGEALSAAKGFATNILDTITGPDGFDSHSPSLKMKKVGVDSADGWDEGFRGEMINVVGPHLEDTIHQILLRAEQAASPGQRRSMKGLDKLNAREPDFLPKLTEGAKKRNINPDWLLNVMATETAGTFDPAITNQYGYTGLIQFGKDAAHDVGTSTSALRSMSGVEQLVYVFKYIDEKMAQYGAIDSQAKLYAAVGAGNYSTNDAAVKFREGSRGYAANYKTWDVNHDGRIQQWEFGPSAMSHLGAGSIFTVNGATNITNANPMPVQVVSAAGTAAAGGSPVGSSGLNFNGLDNALWKGQSPPEDKDFTAGLSAMANSISIFDGKAKDSGVYIEGIGDVAQNEVVPALVMMGALMADDAEKADSFGSKGSEGVQRLRNSLLGLRGDLRDIGITTASMKGVFESSFDNAFTHTQDGFKGMLRDFVLDFAQSVEAMVIKAESANLGDLLFGNQVGGKAGILSKIFGWILGGVGSGVTGGASPADISHVNNSLPVLGQLFHRATGGDVPVGAWSWVGEQGPELVRFGSGAHVYSNSDSRGMTTQTQPKEVHHYHMIELRNPPQAAPVTYRTAVGRREIQDQFVRLVKGK